MSNEVKLCMALMQALWGEVTANMRAALVRQEGDEVQIRFVLYAQPDEEEIEAMSIIGTEMFVYFPDGTETESYDVMPNGRIERRPGEYLVFERKEELAG